MSCDITTNHAIMSCDTTSHDNNIGCTKQLHDLTPPLSLPSQGFRVCSFPPPHPYKIFQHTKTRNKQFHSTLCSNLYSRGSPGGKMLFSKTTFSFKSFCAADCQGFLQTTGELMAQFNRFFSRVRDLTKSKLEFYLKPRLFLS